jgi:hypothetical protein
MTDAQVLEEFLVREKRWLALLEDLRGFHYAQMSKVTSRCEWIASQELRQHSWLGFFWQQEMFWFGFGYHERMWRPVIEADNRSKYSDAWGKLGDQLAGTWETVSTAGNLYRRLWSPATLAEETADQSRWFRDRSRELHEYVVQS